VDRNSKAHEAGLKRGDQVIEHLCLCTRDERSIFTRF
jgi:hypothetical protein